MLGCPEITTLGSYFPQATHSLLIFLPNVMAKLAFPSCRKSVKNQHGLSLHISHWCTNRQSTLPDLLQQHQDHAEVRAEQEQNQCCLEAERLAEREQLEREQDALQEQQLKQFQSLMVSSIFFLQSIIINIVLNQFDEPNLSEDVEQ